MMTITRQRDCCAHEISDRMDVIRASHRAMRPLLARLCVSETPIERYKLGVNIIFEQMICAREYRHLARFQSELEILDGMLIIEQGILRIEEKRKKGHHVQTIEHNGSAPADKFLEI